MPEDRIHDTYIPSLRMINRAIVKDYTVCSQNNVTTHLICELNLDIDPTPCIIDDVNPI